MSVYSIECLVDDFRILVPVNSGDFDSENLWIDGSSKLASWRPVELRWSEITSNEGVPDIAFISPGFYAFNSRAIAVLGSLLREHGELLTLSVDGEEWFAFNPTVEYACLDENCSEWKIRRNGARGRMLKCVLDERRLGEGVIFQIPEKNRSEFYVKGEFVQKVVANQLAGIEFHQMALS